MANNKTFRKITAVMEEVLKEYPSDRIVFNGDNVVYSVCSENGIGYARISGTPLGSLRLTLATPLGFTFVHRVGEPNVTAETGIAEYLHAFNRAALIAAKITEKLSITV